MIKMIRMMMRMTMIFFSDPPHPPRAHTEVDIYRLRRACNVEADSLETLYLGGWLSDLGARII